MMTKKERVAMRELMAAIEGFIDNEIQTEASGDCGSYDVEEIPEVIAGRKALALARQLDTWAK